MKKLFRYYKNTGMILGITDELVCADNIDEAIQLILSTYHQYTDKEKIGLGNEIRKHTKEYEFEKSEILWDRTERNDYKGHFDL